MHIPQEYPNTRNYLFFLLILVLYYKAVPLRKTVCFQEGLKKRNLYLNHNASYYFKGENSEARTDQNRERNESEVITTG